MTIPILAAISEKSIKGIGKHPLRKGKPQQRLS